MELQIDWYIHCMQPYFCYPLFIYSSALHDLKMMVVLITSSYDERMFTRHRCFRYADVVSHDMCRNNMLKNDIRDVWWYVLSITIGTRTWYGLTYFWIENKMNINNMILLLSYIIIQSPKASSYQLTNLFPRIPKA